MANQRSLKSALCCALLLAAAAAARAQADGDYYGVFDLSYGRFQPSGTLREHRFNSNSMAASFIGVNGKYGFDGGWTPGITLETFLRFQDGKLGRRDSDPWLSRNAYVSLESPYGQWRAGRLQTFLFDTTVRFNALGNAIVFSPSVRHVFGSGNLESVQGDVYWDRAVGYLSPNWNGVTLNLMRAQGGKDEAGRYTGASLVVSRGIYALSASAQRVLVDDGIDDPTRETTWQLGASYNLGVARLFAQYTRINDSGLSLRSKVATTGASLPLGPGTVQFQIAYTTADGLAVERRHTTTSLAYVYPYTSLTDFYLVGMDDRVRRQARGWSLASGARMRF